MSGACEIGVSPWAGWARWAGWAESQRPVRRELGQENLDGPEAGREVVAVVTVAQDRVEVRQRSGMAIDRPPGAQQARPQPRRVDARRCRGL